MNSKSYVALLSLLVFALVAYWLSQIPTLNSSGLAMGEMQRLFPKLQARANEVDFIEIQTTDSRFSIRREVTVERGKGIAELSENHDEAPSNKAPSATQWLIVERDGYPADFSKIRKQILGFASLIAVDPKTSLVAKYPRLQVEDVSEPNAKSVQVILKAENHQLAALLIGKRAQNGGGTKSGVSRYYVRKVGEAKSWLAEGSLETNAVLSAWLDNTMLPAGLVFKDIEIKHADGEQLRLIQDETDSSQYHLAGLGEDKVISQFSLNQVAMTLAGVQLQDVALKLVDKKSLGQLILHLKEGGSISIAVVEAAQKKWFQLMINSSNTSLLALREKLQGWWLAVDESTYISIFKRRSDWVESTSVDETNTAGVDAAAIEADLNPQANSAIGLGGILRPLEFGVPE